MRSVTPAIIAVLLATASSARAQRIIYVDDDAVGTQTGTSWTDSYSDLQDALDDARDVGGCPCEVWVAAGTYKPDRGTGDRLLAFELFNNISVYAGFSGSETKRDQRDPALNETILHGDLYGNDDFDFEPTSGCCTENHKGGCENAVCRAAVIERRPFCDQFWDVFCVGFAKELCCDLCIPSLCENSIGVVRSINTDETPVLDGFTITGAHARGTQEEFNLGAGPLSVNSSSLTVNNCVVLENEAAGMTLVGGAPTVTNTTFLRNRTFVALAMNGSEPTVSGCKFIENTSVGMSATGQVVVRDSLFMNNGEGGLQLSEVASAVGCTFIGNRAFEGAGVSASGVHTIADCVFIGNHAALSGGGLTIARGLVVNCLFVANQAGTMNSGLGGGLLANFGTTVLNSTFVGNNASGGGGLFAANAVNVSNTLLWGNSNHESDFSERTQVWGLGTANLDVNYCIVEGWTGDFGGIGNSGVGPMFVDADGPDDILGTEDDNLRLLPGSPAINAGDPVGFVGPAADLDGHPRTMCGQRDIGAYEFGIGDYDCDQIIDLFDFTAWDSCTAGPNQSGAPYTDDCKPFDFNTDSVIDLLDFAGFQRVIESP
jgi:Right handed beta helix region